MSKKNRQTFKRAAAFLTAFTMAVGVMPALPQGYFPQLGVTVSAEEATIVDSGTIGKDDYFKWELDSEGTLTISGTAAVDFADSLPYDVKKIKKCIIEYGMNAIGWSTFSGAANMTSVTIPSSIRDISYDAFDGCSSLTEVTIPYSVEEIAPGAFANCTNLSKVIIPKTVIDIYEYHVFDNCPNLTIYGCTDSVAEKYAQENGITFEIISCDHSSFEKISAKKATCKNIGRTECYACTYCGAYFSDKSGTRELAANEVEIPTTGIHTMTYFPSKDATCTIDGNPEYWMCYACGKRFSDEEGTNEINNTFIPELGHNMVDGACTRCDKKDLSVVGSISGKCGDNVIWTLDSSGLLTISGTGAMYDFRQERDENDYPIDDIPWRDYRKDITGIEIKTGVTHIGSDAFRECSNAKNVTIPEGVTSIGGFAFVLSNYQSIELPESLTTIDEGIFGLSFVESITIPKNVISVPSDMFDFGECKEIYFLNPQTIINLDDMITPKVHGYKNSTSQAYAEKYDLEFVEIPCDHDLTAVSAKSATCTTAGNKAYWHCSTCNDYFSDSTGETETTLAAVTIAAAGHSYSNGVCTACGAADPSYTAPTPAHTHTLTETAEKAPSCTEDGNRAYWFCSDCEKYFLDKDGETETALEETVIPAEGHIFDNGVCTECGENDPDYVQPINPTITSAAAGDSQVTLNWTTVDGAKWYRVYYKVSGTKDWISPVRVDSKTASCTVTGLKNGTKYEFVVKAAINGAWTKATGKDVVAATPMAAAVNPKITSLTADSGKVNVKWNTVSGAKWYRVYYKVSGTKNWISPVRVDSKTTSCTVTGLKNGTTYEFVVKAAVNGAWTKATGKDVVKITSYNPVNPTITKATPGNQKVTLNWNKVAGSKWYRIYYKVSGTSKWISPARVDANTTSYTVTGLKNGVKYEFVVKAAVNGKWTKATGKNVVKATPANIKKDEIEADVMEFPDITLPETDTPVLEFIG